MQLMRLGVVTVMVMAALPPAGGEEMGAAEGLMIQFTDAGGRRVFRSVEQPSVQVDGGDAAVTGVLLNAAGDVVQTVEFSGKEAALGLGGLPVGEYRLRVRCGEATATETIHIAERPTGKGFFPVVCQFSPVPSGKGWHGEEGSIDADTLRDTIDNILAHGFTGIEWNMHLPEAETDVLRNYAQAKGMVITHHLGALEMFGRDNPPEPSVYSAEYPERVRENAEKRLASLPEIARLYNAFPYQDEPFTGGPKSFGFGEDVKAEFQKRYGYALPEDLDEARNDPQVWLDLLDFRTAKFPDAWRHVYRAVKEIDPSFTVVLTHDSHNTFGAGYGSHAEIAIDDVFQWGADFTDMFVYDIYPYWNLDFRFGEPAKLLRPRMAMTHYSFAQMRNLAYAHDKELGFWVGTFNPAWFAAYMDEGNRALYWGEREMAATAVAHGADFILTGYKLPSDAKHWESLGEGLNLIQKAGDWLRTTKKVQAKAAMLFPRTQYLQLQEEYFNVGLSFELFLRAFGEVDVIHEEQVTDAALNGYEALLLFDVALLPEDVARHIAMFAERGGLVIADAVPSLGKLREHMPVLEACFGVTHGETGRIRREGHYVPYSVGHDPIWVFRNEDSPDESVFETDRLQGAALGVDLDLTLVSPRSCTVKDAEVLVATAGGVPAVLARKVGKGHVFLLGFCLQDTYFHTFQENDATGRAQLRALLKGMCDTAGVRAHVYSSNPDIEAVVRANDTRGVLFAINHETGEAHAEVQLADLPFEVARVVDLADGRDVPFTRDGGVVVLTTEAPLGTTRLYKLAAE